MAKFSRKPESVDVIQWTGENRDELKQFIGEDCNLIFQPESGTHRALIFTMRGTRNARPGDYVVKDQAGDLRVMSPDAFAERHEALKSSGVSA